MDGIEPGQNDLTFYFHDLVPEGVNHAAFVFESLDNDSDFGEAGRKNLFVDLISVQVEQELSFSSFIFVVDEELDHADAVPWFIRHRDGVVGEIESGGFGVKINNSWAVIGDDHGLIVQEHLHSEWLAV